MLALFLIQERRKGEESFWKYYLKSLPPNVNSMPLFFVEEEKAMLEGSPVLRTLEKRVKEMDKDFNTLKDNIPEFRSISYSEFAYHRCLASSRVFGFQVNGKKTGGMVPFLGEFLNHNDNPRAYQESPLCPKFPNSEKNQFF